MPSAILTLDARTRPPASKKMPGGAGEFRSMLECAAPSPRKPETPSPRKAEAPSPFVDEDVGAPALVELPPSAADEEFASAGKPEAEADSADGEKTTPKVCDEEAGADAPALPPSAHAIADLRVILGGPVHKPADDEAAPVARANEAPAAKMNAVAHAADRAKLRAAENSAVAAVQTSTTPVSTRPALSEPAQPAAALEADAGGAGSAAGDAGSVPAVRATPRVSDRDAGDSREGAERRGRGDARPLPGATVVAEGAPAPQSSSQPATRAVTATLGAEPSWTAYFRAKPLPAQAPQSLTVQLRPAELGVVTAHLSFAGGRVAVELQAETTEARRQLSADTDVIVRSLRAAGLEVDQVTVQPASQAQDAGRGALPGRGDSDGGGAAFASQEGASERGGRQPGSNSSQGFASQGGGDEIRTGGSADRGVGRYI